MVIDSVVKTDIKMQKCEKAIFYSQKCKKPERAYGRRTRSVTPGC